MSVNPVAPLHSGLLPNTDQLLRLATPGDFVSTLSMGQILKGRVLRAYEGSRYLVDFSGQQKVVDTSIPLKTGEVLYGRVIGLGDQVELQRIAEPGSGQTAQDKSGDKLFLENIPTRFKADLSRIFTEFGGTLNKTDARLLAQQLHSVDVPRALMFAGLLLSKLGMPYSSVRLEALYKTLIEQYPQALHETREAVHLVTLASALADPESVETGGGNGNDLSDLESLLERLSRTSHWLEESETRNAGDEEGKGDDGRGMSMRALAAAVLNVQTGGDLQHRLSTVPFLVDDELIELNIACIDQRTHQDSQTAHRKAVLNLELSELGPLSIAISVTGHHARVALRADDPEAVVELESRSASLMDSLEKAGIQVSELQYGRRGAVEMNEACWLVLQNVISTDSLNRWM